MLAGLLVMSIFTGFAYAGTAVILGFSVIGVIFAYSLGGVLGLSLGAVLVAVATTRGSRLAAVHAQT